MEILLGIPEHYILCTRKIVEEYKVGLYDLYILVKSGILENEMTSSLNNL